MINNMMNQIGINPMGINNPGMNPFGMNPNGIDQTYINIKNIVKPYEDKIKDLEEKIRQKDLQITVLKQKLNNINSNINLMNMNPMMMLQNNPPNIMPDNFEQQQKKNDSKILIIIKTQNNIFSHYGHEGDKLSTLYEKYSIKGWLTNYYKILDKGLTLKENGLKDKSVIFEKPDFNNIVFKDISGRTYNLSLSDDCPLKLAFIYYLIKIEKFDYLFSIINGIENVRFRFNNSNLKFNDNSPIWKFFKNMATPVVMVYFD